MTRRNIHAHIDYANNRMLKTYKDMLEIGGSVRMVEMRDRMNKPYVPKDPEPIHTFLAFANILEGISERENQRYGNWTSVTACKLI